MPDRAVDFRRKYRGGSRIFERGGGSRLGLQAKKGGGADGGGPILGPMLKSLHRGTKGGGVQTPWTPPPPGSAPEVCVCVWGGGGGEVVTDRITP